NTLALLAPEETCDVGSDPDARPRIGSQKWQVFATGSGQFADLETTANSAGYDIKTEGITLGADHPVDNTLSWGFNAGYLATQARMVNGSYSDVNGAKLGLHGTWYENNSYLDGAIGGGFNFYNTWREALGGKATGDTHGYEANALLGGGHDWAIGNMLIGPIASLRYTYVTVDEFTEKGSAAPMHVEDNDTMSLLSRLGARVAWEIPTGKIFLRPE